MDSTISRAHDHIRRALSGFTLIELLVVITIIVVLLALLTPALDRAIYQAELVVCGANHSAITKGVTQYAMGSKRRYPHRQVLWVPEILAVGRIAMFEGGPADDRPLIREHVPLDAFLCPLAGSIDMDTQDPEVINRGFVSSSSGLYYGWSFLDENENEYAGMHKLGDRWGFRDKRFTLIAVDNSITSIDGVENYSAHPDDKGVFTQTDYVYEDAFDVLPTVKFLWAGWFAEGSHDRGLIDVNAAYADGSVARHLSWHWDVTNERQNMPTRTTWVTRNRSPEDDGDPPTEYIVVPRH